MAAPSSMAGDSAIADGLELISRDGARFELPLGFPAFADQVVSSRAGRSFGPAIMRQPEAALGAPDAPAVMLGGTSAGGASSASGSSAVGNSTVGNSTVGSSTVGSSAGPGLYAPGCRGEAVFAFSFNGLIDLPGPDLLVIGEAGMGKPLAIAVSQDGRNWLDLADAPIGVAIDLAGQVPPRIPLRYIRFRDQGAACKRSAQPPAIDAIASLQVALRSEVYFEFDSAEPAERAITELATTLGLIRPKGAARLGLRIEGYADDYGPSRHNMELSRKRAEQVAMAARRAGIAQVEVFAFGEQRLQVPQARRSERWRNRRVELIGYWERQ